MSSKKVATAGKDDGAPKPEPYSACPVDPDISKEIFNLAEGGKMSADDRRHYQNLAVQWQIARNLRRLQGQIADAEQVAVLLAGKFLDGPPCQGCGK